MNFSRVESKARKVRKNSGLEIHPIERLLSEKKVRIAQCQIIVHEREDTRSESVTELRKNSSLDEGERRSHGLRSVDSRQRLSLDSTA